MGQPEDNPAHRLEIQPDSQELSGYQINPELSVVGSDKKQKGKQSSGEKKEKILKKGEDLAAWNELTEHAKTVVDDPKNHAQKAGLEKQHQQSAFLQFMV